MQDFSPDDRPSGKTPIKARSFAVCAVLASCLCAAAADADTLSEADVARLAEAQSPRALAAREAIAVARAEGVQASLYPNPTLSWNREHLPGDAGEREDALALSLPIDRSSRRRVHRKLTSAGVAIARAEAAATQSDVVARALGLFYQLLAQKERLLVDKRTLTRLDEAKRVVTRRKEEGTASGYDQTRIEIEAELAQSRLTQAQARAERLRTRLALLLGVDGNEVSFSGSLAPDTRLSGESAAPSASPALVLLRAAAGHAGKAREAAKRAWIPTLSITAGLKVARAQETEYGYVAGLSIDLPVWTRGQGLRARAHASQRLASARAAVVERSRTLAHRSAAQSLRAARTEATRFAEATAERVSRLQRAVESGYREGQRSLVELLDAGRARTAVEARALELALMIKEAEIALRAARGEFE